jgi:hypothetical protein
MNENGKDGPWSFLYAFFVTDASAGQKEGNELTLSWVGRGGEHYFLQYTQFA